MNTPTQQDLIAVKARALFNAWKRLDLFSGYKVLAVEQSFCFPLLNPETEAPSRSFSEAGKIDVVVRDGNGRVWVVEHKTTSDSLAPDSDYWTRLRMDTQCSKYFLAALHQGHDVAGVIYNVLRRPLHQLKGVPLLDEQGYKQVFDATGTRIWTKDGKKPRETADAEKGWTLQTRPETTDELYARVSETIRENSSEFFGRREVPRLAGDLLEYMNDAWACSQQILYFRNRKLWPRNTEACTAFGACEYFDLCAGRSTVDSIAFATESKAHRELSIESDGDKELLTNSRLRALRKCSRFHQLRYEDKVRKCGEEQEVLAFGTEVHRLLENHFNERMASDTASK